MFVYIQIHVRCDVLVEKDAFPQRNSKSNFHSSPPTSCYSNLSHTSCMLQRLPTPHHKSNHAYIQPYMLSNPQIHTNVCTDVLFLGAEPRIFKAPKALFIGAEPRIFKVPPEAPLKISSEVRRRRGVQEIFREASGGTSNNSGRSPAPAGGARKSKKSTIFVPSLRQP